MRVLLSTFGSAGDVFPMVGLALTLRARGHDVTLATNDHFEPLAARHGIPFEPLGTDAEFQAAAANPDLWHPRKSFQHIYRSFSPALERHYQLHAELAARGDGAAITNCFGFGALLAHEKFGLPVITLDLQPVVLWSDREPPSMPGLAGPKWLRRWLFRLAERYFLDPIVCPDLNAWRATLGLPPVSRIARWWHSPYGVLAMFPAWFCPPQPDWPPNLMQADFPLWNAGSDAGLDPAVQEFLDDGDPPIVFTPGSANAHARAFFEAAVDACRRLGRRGILLTQYGEQVPAGLPDGVVHFGYVPLDLLLPRSAAFVHHGGIGSTAQALAAGIPQLIVPLAHDQFDNGERLKRLGVGEWIAERKITGARAAEAVTRLLDRKPAQACRVAAERMSRRDGLAQAANLVEARLGVKPGLGSQLLRPA